MNEEHVYAAGVQKLAAVGAVRTRRLKEYFGSFKAFWLASDETLRAAQLFGREITEKIISGRHDIDPETEYRRCEKAGVGLLTYLDEEYPSSLAACTNPPAVLAYQGDLNVLGERMIAVVGTRKATAYGLNACRRFAGELAAAGVTIVSGGARGIDSCAHTAALLQGRTVCVLACGLDITYPPENKNLFDEIATNGLLLSEYALGTEPLGRRFPARNRIISGLARGVLVVEAARRSGSLITADFALEEGRDVFAIPGSIFSSESEGANHLIRQGAGAVTSPRDILEEYGWLEGEEKEEKKVPELTSEEELVYRCCSLEEATALETIVLQSTYEPAKVNYLLLQLELKGLVKNVGDQRYMAVTG